MYVSVFLSENIILTPAVQKGFCQNSFATCLKTTVKSIQREVVAMLCAKNTIMAIQPDPPLTYTPLRNRGLTRPY